MGVEKRREPRTKKRMACAVKVKGRRHSGVVLDVSPRGMFVQTNAQPRPGEPVEVELILPGCKEAVVVHARVARKRVVPAQLVAVAHGGIGLSIESAPEAYYTFMNFVARTQAAPTGRGKQPAATPRPAPAAAPAKPAATKRRFRVRVERGDSAETRQFLISCGSEEQARQQVADELGSEWKVVSLETV